LGLLARQQAGADVTLRGAGLDPRADNRGFPLLLTQVGVDVGAMSQIVAKDRVHVGQFERREPRDDILGGRAVQLRADNRIERHARPADAHIAIDVRPQRRRGFHNSEGHELCLSVNLPSCRCYRYSTA